MTPASPHPLLRAWRDDDAEPYVELHLRPEICEWLGATFTRESALALLARDRAALETRGWGLWALLDDDGVLADVAGLQPVREGLPGHPGVEAAWRLHPRAWGRGVVTRAMRGVLDDAFARGLCDQVWSMTAATNARSQAVMQRLGFVRVVDGDFDHPRLPDGHPLRRHVLYRASAPRG